MTKTNARRRTSSSKPRLTRKRRDMDIDSTCGTLTHQLVASILTLEYSSGGAALSDTLIIERANEIVRNTQHLGSHGPRILMRVATASAVYLKRYRPSSECVFAGAEVVTGDGRVDLAWCDPTDHIFFDELKTSRRPESTLGGKHLEQVSRYAQDGRRAHGNRFLGVRYIPLLNPAGARWISPAGDRVAVSDLASSPFPFAVCAGVLS